MSTTVKFMGYDCIVEKQRYTNGRPALQLIDAHDGEPFLVATVNLPDIVAGRNEVFIKDYSENEGILAVLEEAGVVKATGRTVISGFVEMPACELQPPFREKSLSEVLEGVSSKHDEHLRESTERALDRMQGKEGR